MASGKDQALYELKLWIKAIQINNYYSENQIHIRMNPEFLA